MTYASTSTTTITERALGALLSDRVQGLLCYSCSVGRDGEASRRKQDEDHRSVQLLPPVPRVPLERNGAARCTTAHVRLTTINLY